MRFLRVVRFLHSVRKMVLSVVGSLTSLFWAMFFMFFVTFLASIIFMQGIETHLDSTLAGIPAGVLRTCTSGSLPWEGRVPATNDLPIFWVDLEDSLTVQIQKLYGSVVVTMMTLFGAISGGSEWAVVADPVRRISPIFMVLWVFFMCIMIFGVLNILTGLFVDAAMNAAKSDHTAFIREALADEMSITSTLRQSFAKSDTDGSGTLTQDEFDALLGDEEVCAMLDHVGLQVHEASGLFRLLDDDKSGRISVDEFIGGCIRLKGGAKEVDIITVIYLIKRMAKINLNLLDLGDDILARVGRIEETQRQLAEGTDC